MGEFPVNFRISIVLGEGEVIISGDPSDDTQGKHEFSEVYHRFASTRGFSLLLLGLADPSRDLFLPYFSVLVYDKCLSRNVAFTCTLAKESCDNTTF